MRGPRSPSVPQAIFFGVFSHMRHAFALALLLLSVTAPAAAEVPAAQTQATWKKQCASCHGQAGAADTKMGRKHEIDDMTDAGWQDRHDDGKLRDAIAHGKKGTKMKAYDKKLSAEEIDALVAHIRTLRKAD